MICGVCHAQESKKRKKKCITCKQSYRKYPYIPGYHGPLEIAQRKFTYSCNNALLGCKEQLNHLNVEEHDKLCEYMPYQCRKIFCTFICPFFDIPNRPHAHLKPIFSLDTSQWSMKLNLVLFYSIAYTRIRLSKNVPHFALLKGDANIFDHLFKPIVSFAATPMGDAIKMKITWFCKEVYSIVNIADYQFLVTIYLDTEAGTLKRCFITQANFLSAPDLSNVFIETSFFELLLKAFEISTCVECDSKNPAHFHVKICVFDDPNEHVQLDV